MIYRIILFTVFFVVLFNNSYAQIDSVNLNVKTNDEIVTGLIEKNLDELKSFLESDTVYVEIREENPFIKNFFNGRIRNSLLEYETRPFNSSLTHIPAKLEINNLKISVSYPKYGSEGVLGNKSFNRVINISFDVNYLRLNDNSVIYTKRITDKYSDEVEVSLKQKIENSNYSFLSSNLPEDNFLNKYLIPAGLIAVSAVTIVLFFVIRSN